MATILISTEKKAKAYLIRGTKKLPALTEYPNPYIGGHSVYSRQPPYLRCTVILSGMCQLTLTRITRQVSPTLNLILLLCYSYFYFVKMPDIIYVLLNGSVRREFSNMSHIQHNKFCPAFLISVSFFYALLSFCIRTEVFQAESKYQHTVCTEYSAVSCTDHGTALYRFRNRIR